MAVPPVSGGRLLRFAGLAARLAAAAALLLASGRPAALAAPLSLPAPAAAPAEGRALQTSPRGLLPPAPIAAEACPPASRSSPLPLPSGPLLRPPSQPPAAGGISLNPGRSTPDYRERLATTAWGWPRLPHWCVWVEPPAAGDRWQLLWSHAVEQALSHWQQQLSLQRVADPASAQVRILRRRPPLLPGPDGRLRASHGRALLSLLQVERNGQLRAEPSIDVWLSPGQRPAAMQATALHELGHAFGLWGHSDDPADAMAATPTADAVLQLSPRDRSTLLWLYAQPTRFGLPSP